jgi:hypothetical protein
MRGAHRTTRSPRAPFTAGPFRHPRCIGEKRNPPRSPMWRTHPGTRHWKMFVGCGECSRRRERPAARPCEAVPSTDGRTGVDGELLTRGARHIRLSHPGVSGRPPAVVNVSNPSKQPPGVLGRAEAAAGQDSTVLPGHCLIADSLRSPGRHSNSPGGASSQPRQLKVVGREEGVVASSSRVGLAHPCSPRDASAARPLFSRAMPTLISDVDGVLDGRSPAAIQRHRIISFRDDVAECKVGNAITASRPANRHCGDADDRALPPP